MKSAAFFLLFLCCLFSCTEQKLEDEEEILELGNLEIITIFEGGEPVSDVSITLVRTGKIQVTDVMGKTIFSDLEYAEYEFLVSPSFTETSINITVKFDSNTTEPFIFVVGPKPLAPVPVDINFLLSEAYNSLGNTRIHDATGYSLHWGDIGTDVSYINPSFQENYVQLDRYLLNPNNAIIDRVWEDYYKAVRIVNTGLDAILDDNYTSESQINITTIEAEFKFLRALLYFDLVKLYGNPVLVTTAKIDFDNPEVYQQGREIVYGQIIEDLRFAQQNLNTFTTAKKASDSAASALLGKVYLTMAGFPLSQTDKYILAIQELEKVLSGFSLSNNYGDVFNTELEGQNNEIVFAIDFESSGNFGVIWGPLGISLDDALLPVPGFLDKYSKSAQGFIEPITFPLDVDDNRFFQNVATFSVSNGQENQSNSKLDWRPYKYKKDISFGVVRDGESFDYPYLRYSDVLLMLAEAENTLNGPTEKAYQAINQVRRRAFGNIENDVPSGLSQEEFLDFLLLERRLELCFEGQVKDDLIRTGKLQDVINDYNSNYPEIFKDFQSHEFIWPIPQTELNSNPNVVQNIGY